jgi:low temperature requirement protein LtrA
MFETEPPPLSGGRWTRLREFLWQPPRPHGAQPRTRTVTPLELFYDLVVVVLVGQAAHHLADHLTWPGLGEFAAVFTLVWLAWFNGTMLHELHSRDDSRGRTVLLAQILVLVALGSSVPEAGGARGGAFAVTAGVLFALLALLWFLAGRRDQPQYRRASRGYVAFTVLCAAILTASAGLPAAARLWVWGLTGAAYLAAFAVVTANPAVVGALTITTALIERFGLLIIIVLGETVTGVVAGLALAPLNALTLAVALTGVVIGFGAWWTYFDFAGHRPLRPGRRPTLCWILTHLPLTAGIATMGAAMLSLAEHAHDTRTPAPTAWTLCVSAAIVLAATALIMTTLAAWRDHPRLNRAVAMICVAASVACLVLGVARPPPIVLTLALVALYSLPWSYAVAHVVSHDSGAGRR